MGGNNTQPLVTVGAAIVGAYVGGYQGMQIGMALSSLFYADEAKDHLPYNDPLKVSYTIAAPDIVPKLIGTDICPGHVIYVNEATKGLHDPEWFGNEDLMAMLRKILMVSNIQFYNIEFIASFSNVGHVNQCWFDKKHHWLWLRFNDRLYLWHNYLELGWVPLTRLFLNWTYTYYNPEDNWTPLKSITAIRFRGMFLEPKSNNTTALMHNSIDPQDQDAEKEDWRRFNVAGGMPTHFPDLRSEITGTGARYSTTSGWSGYGISSYDHTFRDHESHYMYGVLNFGDYHHPEADEIYFQKYVDIRKLNFNTYTYENLVSLSYAYYNITKGHNSDQSISRQDIDGNPDHLYIFHGRNWYYAGTYNHHHAQYSLEYDIFYIDRSDDSVHSVVYNQRLNIAGDDNSRFSDSNPIPRIKIASMEVVGDYIYLFGMEWQSHSIWHENFILTQDSEIIGTNTRIYADFSLYPHDYWNDDRSWYGPPCYCWAWFSNDSHNVAYVERYQIVAQTSTYMDVKGIYYKIHEEGEIVNVSRIRGGVRSQANWAIIGEGSSRTVLVVQEQFPFEPKLFDGQQYDSVQFLDEIVTGGLSWGWEISSMGTTTTYLVGELTRDPVPGEIVFFSYEHHDLNPAYDYNTNRFSNPQDCWFHLNLYKYFAYNNIDCSFIGRCRYFNIGLQNSNGWGKGLILKFNKNTGEYLGKVAEYLPTGYGYTGIQRICVVEQFSINTVSSDVQVASSWRMFQPYTYPYNDNIVYSKPSMAVHDIVRFRSKSHGHACGKDFMGCIKTRKFDLALNEYVYHWYALIIEYQPRGKYVTGIVDDGSNRGTYLVDIGENGIFPHIENPLDIGDVTSYSALLGSDISLNQSIKFFRGQIATGPLYSQFIKNKSMNRDSGYLRQFDYDRKLVFVSEHQYPGWYEGETWIYEHATEYNRMGFVWPMCQATGDQYDEQWGYSIDTVNQNQISNKYFLGMSNYFSNFVDSPIDSAIQSVGSATIDNDSSDYADEVIDDVIYFCGERQEIKEYRFMFSKCWDKKTTKINIFKEIAATCQGILVSNCGSTSTSPITLKIPRPNEPIDWFFGFHEQIYLCTQSPYTDRVYADFSDVPVGYWKGDQAKINHLGEIYSIAVEESYIDYVQLESSLPFYSDVGDSVQMIKDNIKEGSFTYSKKPQFDKSNRIRIEFINRLMKYTLDIAEIDEFYKQDIIDGRVILRQYELHGIKRASQAARMAMRYLDYEQFVNWMCSFQTDFMGTMFCVGDIIGITHPVTGWLGKPFRIISMDYLENHDVIIETEEYVSGVYHDYSNPVYQGGGGGSNGQLNYADLPSSVQRLYVHYDPYLNVAYVTFYSPANTNAWFAANVYISINGGEFSQIGIATTPTASVVYSSTGTTETSDMEPTRTKYNEMFELGYQYTDIPYDPLTMLGTFPASGYLWVNGELIYYNGLDTINNKFVNCVRCIDVPEYQYAADAPDDGYNWTNPLIVLADVANAFSYKIDPSLLVDLTDEALQTEGSEIEYSIPTITFQVMSLNIAGLEENNDTSIYTIQLRQANGRPYSPTLLRYVRDL